MVLTRRAPYLYEDDDRIAVASSGTARASLRSLLGGQTRRHHITEDDEALISDLTTTRSHRRTTLQSVPVPQYDNDERVVPIRRRRPEPRYSTAPVQQPRRKVPTFWIIVGMLITTALWYAFIHVGVWCINTFYDPAHYTQTAHLDATTITDREGRQSQIHAIVDGQGHLDLIIIPDDPSKSRLLQGVRLTGIDDPQHAILTVTASGTVITVSVQGPMRANWFTTYRQSAEWTTDVSQQKQAQGG